MARGLPARITAFGALAGLSLLFQSDVSFATEIKLATAKAADAFVKSLQNSPSLEHAGIKVVVQRLPTDDAVLDAVLRGSADLGLFALDVLSKRKFDDQPRLYSVFTRPFFFESSDQIFRLEQTPLGDAVLADVARAGVLPLAYWNGGLSQIMAKRPLESVESFRGLIVASDSENWSREDTAKPILNSLGAEPVATFNVAMEFSKANVGAAIWKPSDDGNAEWLDPKDYGFQIYATDFQPNVGILASSLPYWNSLQEKQKAAWKAATAEATKQAINEIDKREYPKRENKKISFVPANRKLIVQFGSSVSDSQHLLEDYKLLNEAKVFVSSHSDSKKKSN